MEINSRETILYLDEENIQEFLNVLFPLIEALRTAIRENIEFLTIDTQGQIIYNETLKLINDCLYFENVWNYSYSTWHSAFKADRKNNSEYRNTVPVKFYDIQTYYPKADILLKDMHIVKGLIKNYILTLNTLKFNEIVKQNFFLIYWMKFVAFIKIFKY